MGRDEILISLGFAEASDGWGFVGVVKVGQVEAYRTLEAFPAPLEALSRTQQLVGSVLGELLAGAEWRRIRDVQGRAPTREDYNISAFQRTREGNPVDRPPGG
jgi:hypothetical protein